MFGAPVCHEHLIEFKPIPETMAHVLRSQATNFSSLHRGDIDSRYTAGADSDGIVFISACSQPFLARICCSALQACFSMSGSGLNNCFWPVSMASIQFASSLYWLAGRSKTPRFKISFWRGPLSVRTFSTR